MSTSCTQPNTMSRKDFYNSPTLKSRSQKKETNYIFTPNHHLAPTKATKHIKYMFWGYETEQNQQRGRQIFIQQLNHQPWLYSSFALIFISPAFLSFRQLPTLDNSTKTWKTSKSQEHSQPPKHTKAATTTIHTKKTNEPLPQLTDIPTQPWNNVFSHQNNKKMME